MAGLVTLHSFPVRFRRAFAHASATRRAAENVIVAMRCPRTGVVGYGEACPRAYVTGETTESVVRFLERFGCDLAESATGMDALKAWMACRADAIDASPAAFAALEVAWLDRLGRSTGRAIEALIGLGGRAAPVRYSAVLGVASGPVRLAQAVVYRVAGLRDVKIKLTGEAKRDAQALRMLRRVFGAGLRVRADANNLWRDADECIASLAGARGALWAVEEPLAAGDLDGFRAVADGLGVRIVLDESLCRADQLDVLAADPARWVVNIRVSKMGGVLRSLAVAARAAELGIAAVIGAHVGETSILTRAALAVAAGTTHRPVAMEGGFGTRLLEADLVGDPVMFGRGGWLDPRAQAWHGRPGLGLEVLAERLSAA